MESKKPAYALIAGLSFAVGFLLYLFFFSSSQAELPDLTAVEQPQYQRMVYPFTLERDTMFTVANDTVYRGMTITSNTNSFFITDFGDGLIKQFDLSGNFIGTFGEGEGRGPGEFLNLSMVSATDQALWVSDLQALRLTSFSLSSGEFEVFPTEKRPTRIAVNDSLVAVKWTMSETMFTLYDTDGNKRFDFEHPAIIPTNDPIAFDGWITLSEEFLLYIPINYGAIFGFDLGSGKHTFTIPTPDGGPLPSSEQRTETGRLVTIAPNSQARNSGLKYVSESGKLVVFTYIRGDQLADGSYDVDGFTYWLDVYDIEDPSYLYSIEFPHIASSFTFIQDYLLVHHSRSARGISYVMDDAFKSLIFN
ncbi:MAG: hypothetical protein ACNA78_11995 [Balneolaceae bacterium]